MEKGKKIIALVSSIIVIIFFAVISVTFFSPAGNDAPAVMFTINKGETVKEIASALKNEKIIKSPYAFLIYTGLTGKYSKLQAGEYLLSSKMSVANIVRVLSKGETVKENITIIEGWDLRDINNYLIDKGMAANEGLYSLTGTPAEKEDNANIKDLAQRFDFLSDKPEKMSLEGYLFPDTYYLDKGDGAEDLIEKALKNFGEKLTPEMRNEIKKQKKTIFDIVTMASMIEKEVKTLKDKKIVSGILWKRMNTGMRLQVDATILYEENKEGLKIYTKDTQIDSPYNTYRVDGLPLGPISNPGLDSIIAAIYPTTTPYYYYLSSPDGKTIFSKTLEEHNINKAKYLK